MIRECVYLGTDKFISTQVEPIDSSMVSLEIFRRRDVLFRSIASNMTRMWKISWSRSVLLFVTGCLLLVYLVLFQSNDLRYNELQIHKKSVTANVREKMSVCPSRVVYVEGIGRMGNRFFEYLAAFFHAQALGSELFIDESLGQTFDQYFTSRETPIIDWAYLKNTCSISKSQFTTLDDFVRRNKGDASLEFIHFRSYPSIPADFWTSFYTQRDQLIRLFQWKPEIKLSVNKKLAQVKKDCNCSTTVAVHARMSDYHKYLKSRFKTVKMAGSSYFTKAMNYFRDKYENPVFMIFSDDMPWCRKNIIGSDVIYTGHNNQSDPGSDAALMSSCDHIILTYGTFGMMNAWFNNHGEIIMADNFKGYPDPLAHQLKNIPGLKVQLMDV